MGRRAGLIAAAVVACLAHAPAASAFPHVVKPGETLAQIAQRVYGNAKYEVVLAGANFLDVQGGSAPVPGMRLEIPAPGFHRITAGETWGQLALQWLGDPKRADVLARMNHAVSWVPPVEAQEIQIPYVLTVIAADNDRVDQVAKRYYGDPNRAWELDAYNARKEPQTGPLTLKRGEVVLVPLLDLALTDAGRAEAQASLGGVAGESGGGALEAQRRAEAEIPSLLADVRGGRWLDAVARGSRILGGGDLTRAQLARIHRALLEAYVALDAPGAAAGACAAWRANEPGAKLDPVTVSPKVRAACK